jgi:hypothetical protein
MYKKKQGIGGYVRAQNTQIETRKKENASRNITKKMRNIFCYGSRTTTYIDGTDIYDNMSSLS